MKKIWGKVLLNDPAYNPNLSLNYEDFSFGIRKKFNPINLYFVNTFELNAHVL